MMNKAQQRQLMYGALVVLVLVLLYRMFGKKSHYTNQILLKPVMMETKTTDDSNFFDKEYKMDCIPGLPDSMSQFSWGLTPGGVCGDQEMIRKQMREYTIDEGIGGNLLEKF